MENYEGLHAIVRMPLLLSNSSTLSNVAQMTKKIAQHVNLQCQYALRVHSFFEQLSNRVEKLCLKYQEEYQPTSGSNSLVCKELIKTLYIMFHSLNQQSFKNQISLKTILKTEKERSLLNSINQKFSKISLRTKEYLRIVDEYQEKEVLYIQKCEGFKDLQINTIKYYMLHLYNKKINKVRDLEFDLQKILIKLKTQKSMLQILYKESQKLLIELFSRRLKKIYDIVALLQQALIRMLSVDDVIIEEGSRDYLTNLSQEGPSENPIRSSEQAVQMAKSILHNQRTIRNVAQMFLQQIVKSLQESEKKLRSAELKKVSLNLKKQKTLIEQAIGPHAYSEGVNSEEKINVFQELVRQIRDKLKGQRIFEKYKVMEEDLLNRLQKDLKSFSNNLPNGDSIKDNQQLYTYYLEMTMTLKKKYSRQAEDINNGFREDITQFIKQIKQLLNEYSQKLEGTKVVNPSQTRIDDFVKRVFVSETYKVFKDRFTTEPTDYQFIRSPYLVELLKLKGSHLDNFSADWGSQTCQRKEPCFESAFCCGKKKDKLLIDSFSCALMHTILLQGKLNLYKKEIVFDSPFNCKTLFGKTELKIPSKDIIKFERYSSSLKGITIQTTHGALTFVSFLTDPLFVMKSHYSAKSSTQRSCQKQKQRLLEEPHLIVKFCSFKSQIINRFLYLGFTFKSYNTLQKASPMLTQTAHLNQVCDHLEVGMEYLMGRNPIQVYKFSVKKNNSKLEIEYSLEQNITRDCKEIFLQLIRSLVDEDGGQIHNTRSQIFEISSINENEEMKYRRRLLQQDSLQSQTESLFKIPHPSPIDTIEAQNRVEDEEQQRMGSNTPKPPQKQHEAQAPDEEKQTPEEANNPLVVYIIVAIISLLILVF